MTNAPSITADELLERISRLPRRAMAVLPTGLQDVPRLAAVAGTESLLVKRDDLTGVGFGGNKSRAMEFIIGDAIAQGCDSLVAGGGAEQSNHAVQCVASANKAGLAAFIVLQKRPDARSSGNALLHELLGGTTVWIDSDPELTDRTSAASHMHAVADRLRASGRKPYVLESSLHPLSVIAYANAAVELANQLPSPQRPTRVYITSEGAALGGLLLGAKLMALPWEIIGMDWRPQEAGTALRLTALIGTAADRLGLPNPITEHDIVIKNTGGPAYGVGQPASWNAIAHAARLEGLLLDPVYTAKGMAGTLTDLMERPLPHGGQAVFIHTGGVAALFAYESELRSEVIPVCVPTRE